MKRNRSIQIKAAILMIVFSLNTIIGFACAIGLKEALVSAHHDAKETKAVVHVHADGKKHIHYEKEETKPVVHVHADGKKHVHQEKAKQAQDRSNKSADLANKKNSQDDKNKCCTTKVAEFEQLDKVVRQSLTIVQPVFFTGFIASYCDIKIYPTSDIVRDIKPFVRSYHPPISDIRIAIQSFQI